MKTADISGLTGPEGPVEILPDSLPPEHPEAPMDCEAILAENRKAVEAYMNAHPRVPKVSKKRK
jgi:hypothetical protein